MIYTVIIKNSTIIADYSESEGDFQQVSLKILKSITNNKSKEPHTNDINNLVVQYEKYEFNILIDKFFTYMCITQNNSSFN